MSGIRIDRWLLSILYLLAFILLREWLIPVMNLTDTGHLSLFLLFIIMSFLLSILSIKWQFTVPLKAFYVFWVVHYVYFGIVLFKKETITLLIQDFYSNFAVIITGDWVNISNPFRTILFFVLLWMTTYLLHHWIEARKNIFIFYVMTVVFIALIDTFSAYSADSSILRIMLTGLVLLGLLSITRLAQRHNTSISLRTFTAISVPLLFVVVVSGALVIFLPKQEPIWADPVPFLKSMVDGADEGGSGGGISKSGYDPDDSRLGGPFLEDKTLVFEAEVDKKQYWKVETKNIYTSKGWEQSISEGNTTPFFPGMAMGEFRVGEGIESKASKQTQLYMSERFPFIIYPYGMTTVFTDDDVTILNEVDSGKYRTLVRGNESSLDSYEMEYVEHDFSLKALRETTMDSLQSLEASFAEFLQLPNELPNRIGELAESITASSDNVYDKTKAIERYFGRNGFIYDQKNVAVPGANDDYVDQFLFDTKRGYCDNYSTSMVVMLRTIGIPARWVKGFAPGEHIRNSDGSTVYRVTNGEAHSWVEAYMPGIGWMPFEPTIGFGGPASIEYDIELDVDDPEVPEMPELEREQLEQKAAQKANDVNRDFTFNKVFSAIGQWVKERIWRMLLITGVLLFTGWRLFAIRRKWIPKMLVPMYKYGELDWSKYEKQYKSLLKQLDRFGLKRKSDETLFTYAIKVDRHFGGDSMRELTSAYEKGLYGENKTEHDWHRLQKMWEDLIIRTSD